MVAKQAEFGCGTCTSSVGQYLAQVYISNVPENIRNVSSQYLNVNLDPALTDYRLQV